MEKISDVFLKYKVNKEDEGKTAERILKREFDISSSHFTTLKLSGKIFINGKVCRSIDKVFTGDVVSADISENEEGDIPEYVSDVKILFEDAHVLVAEKPAGLSMHPCIANYEKTFAGAVIHHYRKNGEKHLFHAVNRLDKDTSGICLIAKNRYSHSILSEQVKNSVLKKEYNAVVHGKIEKDGVLDFPIEREEKSMLKRIVTDTGKKAVTVYSVIKSADSFSLINVKLKTGRTHQIRVHFSHIGHPLYGDWLYGKGDEEDKVINRQALHSSYIEFIHPVSKEKLSFESELPDDIVKLLTKFN